MNGPDSMRGGTRGPGRAAAVRMAAGLAAVAALAAFAPDAAAHVGADATHQRIYNPHNLDQPRIVSRPASGDTYYPGETITVYVPWGRTLTRQSISVNSVGTVQLVLTVGGAQRTLTGIWEDRSARYGPAFTIRRLYFDYVVQAGDRDTNGVALAQDALSSPGNAESGVRGTAGSSFRQFELEKALHGFGDQSGHKVDTPAPSFAGVSSPSLILYSCGAFDDCGSASHRLPTLSNAAAAHNVTYSVAPERPLPSGLVLNSSTATITGSHSGASARQSYTLRATDGFNRTADLTFYLEVRDDVGIESITFTSNPGSDKTYGKNGDFGTNDTITARVDFSRNIGSIIRSNVCLNIRIGSNTRRVCNPTGATRQDKLDFSYAVVESDWDGDGISFPANPMGAGKSGYLRFYRAGIGGGDNRIDRSFGAVLDDPNHKVRGRQTTPSFGSTASPSFSWVKDNAVSQVLPAATGGDGGLTYGIEEGLPDGLVFTAATRTLSGTPTAVQGATNYTLVATDGDGDKAELRFSVEIEEIAVSISSPSVAEGAAGETAALPFAVTLNRAPGRQVTVDWAAAADPGTAASGADYTAFSGGALTFSAAETSKTVEVTVTGDALDEPDETIRIALSNPSGAVVGSAATGVGTITDDDPTPTLTLALSDPDAGRPDTIRESGAGNATTVTASLGGGTSGEAITVTVSAASTYAALAADGGFTLSAARTLTIAAGAAASAGVVTIAATDDTIDSRDKTATVSGAVAGGHGLVAAPADLTLTIADEDSRPSSALALAPASVSESGGVATVTATLSHPSAEAVTIAVSATASTGAADGDFTLSTANTLTVAAGRTTSAGLVTVTAVGNPTSSPDKEVTVKGSASGSPGAADPPDATLTLRDDDGPPTVSLVLSSSSVSESGGVATVTASLNGGTSGEAVTVTVAVAPVAESGAVAGDFGLSGGTTLTIAANAAASTGTVTITGVDNDLDAPDKRVTVSGTAAGGNGVANPASATLTLADDEALPTATLALAPASIAEAGGLATVTATLSGESSAATTLTVTAAAGANAAAGDFTLSAATTLTIAAGETASAGTVTVAAVADTTDSPDKLVTVGAAAAGGNGIADPAAATLTVTDDDALPTLTLTLSPSTIDESGAGSTATVTAALSHPSSEAVTVTVSASAVSPADAGDFSLSAADTLTIAAGATTSAGAVTVAAVDDRTDAPDKRVRVTGAASGGRGVADPAAAALTIDDDDDPPGVTLSLSPASISENGGTAEVSAALSRTSSAATTISVAAATGFYGIVTRRFSLNGIPIQAPDRWIVIAAGRTTSTDTAAIAAVDDDVHQGGAGRSVTVTATMINDQGTSAVTGAALTLSDDETLPTAALVLTPASITESGGISTVTATLSGPSNEAVTVTVAAAAGAGAVSGDFALSTATTLTLAAGATTSAGLVTVTANGNAVDSPNKSVTVSGTAAGGNSVANPPAVTLTLEDDDALPTVALALTPSSISETGGISTVTATLSGPSSEAVTVTVAASAVSPAVAGDFTLSAATTLTLAAGQTTSAGLVTVTANGNDVDAANKSVTVSGTATGGNSVANPSAATLTLTDDDTAGVSVSPSTSTTNRLRTTESGGTATFTVALDSEPTGDVALDVASTDTDEGTVMPATLTFTSNNWSTAQTVTLTGVNDNPPVADGSRNYTVTLTIDQTNTADSNYDALSAVTVYAVNSDNEFGLAVGSVTGQATESGGTATFTVALLTRPSEAVTVSVTSRDEGEGLVSAGGGAPAASTTLTFAAAAWSTAQTVTVTGVQDTVDDGTAAWNVRLDPSSGDTNYGGLLDEDVSVSTTDDDGPPTVTLALNPASIAESGSGNVATVTARLSHASAAATTVTVVSGTAWAAGSDAVIVIPAGATAAASDTATVVAADNATDEPDRTGTVTATIANDRAAADGTTMTVTGATLTITDDDAAPTAALALAPSSVSENGGMATVTATLSHPSSEPSTVTVSSVSGLYTVGLDATITIAAGSTTAASDTVLVTAVDDDIHQGSAGRSATVAATAANGQGVNAAVTGATLTLTDDETLPTAALVLTPASITESGGISTVTAELSGPSSAAVTVTVAAAAGSGAVSGDFALSTATTLTIAAGSTVSAGAVTVTANGNTVDSPNKSVTVSGTAAGGNGVVNPPNVTLTLEDDETLPTVALVLSPSSVTETGGISTVTATLSGPSSEAVTVTVAASAGTGAVAADFDLSSATTLTIAAGATTSAGLVTVTANGNTVDSPNKSVTVSGTSAGGNSVAAPPNVTLTLEDDETLPTVALVLTPTSISESGGVSTVTATLSGPSSEAVTVTVAAAPVASTGAVSGDFALSTATTLTLAAGSTTSAGVVTVTANGNTVDSPNKSVTVSGTSAGGNDVANPPAVTLTLEDDDALPTAALVLTPSSITEEGGISTVTATLSGPSSEAVTVTVAAAAGAGAVSGDFDLSSAKTLTIAAGATVSAGVVTVTANGNDVDSPNKSVTVSGTASGGRGVADPPAVTLTLEDDDALPTVALVLTPTSISETGGVSTVTATLSGPSSEAVTVTVAATAVSPAVAGDFTLSTATTLTLAAGATVSAGVVTVTANGNDVDAPNKSVTVSGTATGGNSVANPSAAALTLTDDDTAGVAVSPATSTTNRLRTTESGGTATFTVALDSEPTGDVALDVASTDTGEGTVAPAILTFTSSDWSTAQTVTLTGVDDSPTPSDPNPSAGNRSYTVTVTVDTANTADSNYDALTALTVYAVNADDDYGLAVGSVSGQATEAGGASAFTVALRTQPAEAVTVSVTSRDEGEGLVSAGGGAPAASTTLTFAAAAWSTAQTVTVTGVQDPVDDGTAAWNVRLDPSSGDTNYDGLTDEDVSVTTADDDGPPGVALALDPATLDESGAATVATVTATLSHPSGAATTVTVTAVSGFYAAGTDAAIVIPAGATAAASDTATVAAVDNDTDAPDRTGTVTASITNDRATADSTTMAVTGAALTVRDDDAAPTAGLFLSPSSVSENGGLSTVTATLSNPSSEPSTVTVAAVSGAYTVGTDATITIAAGATTAAADTVLVTAVDDAIHQGSVGRSVTVAAALANGQGAGPVTGATLTLTDDETLPTAVLVLGPASISETGGVSTVTATLSGPSSAAVTVTVGAAAGTGAVAADFALSTATTLTFAAGATTSAGVVTVTANGNAVDSPDKSVTVSGTAAGGNGVANPPNVTLTLEDDETLPTVALMLSDSSISETGGVSTVTATLSGPSSATVTVTVTVAAAAVASTGAVSGDFALSTAATLTFAANATTSTGLVTVTATGNTVDSPNKSVTVSGTAAGGNSVANPPNVTLTLEDDDALPTAALVLTPTSISESGGLSTVTATLSGPSSEAVTVTVAASAGAGAVAADFDLSTATTLTIAVGATTSAGVVTVTANGNAVDSPNKSVTVSGTAAGGNSVADPPAVTLTLEDDDALPTVALVLSPSSITETGGISTVTATLSGASSEAVTVTVAASAGTDAVAADFTLSTATTLTLAAGATTSAGTVTVTANGNAVDSPNKSVTVSGTAAGGNSVVSPPDVTLTLEDDDALPTVALVLMPSSISETGGVSTVTATLSGPSSEAVTVTVAAAAVSPAVAGDFTLSTAATLTLAAGATTSAGLVTVSANGNDVDAANKSVTVSGTATGGNSVADPSNVTLTLTDDDTAGVSVSPSTSTTNRLRTTESGGTATFTVKLDSEPTGDVALDVASTDTDEGTVMPATLTFTSSDWSTAQTVTLTGVDDSPPAADGSQSYTVTLTIDQTNTADANYDALTALTVYAVNSDNEFGLDVGSVTGQATEAGGTATFTVALLTQPSAAVTVAVSSRDTGEGLVSAGGGAPAASTTLTFAAAAWSTAQTVTVTGVQDTVDDGTVTWAVRLDPASGDADYDVLDSEDVSVSTTDDDGPPTVTLALNPASIAESGSGNVATVTARLSHASGAATTVTVASGTAWTAGTDAVIVIAAGATQAASDTATVVAANNATDEPDRTGTVTAAITNARAAADSTTMTVTGASLTVRDDDAAPTAALSLDPASVSENGGLSTVTATLSHPSSEPSTVTVTAGSGASGLYTVGLDATIVIAAGSTTAASDTATVAGMDDAVHQGSAGRRATVTATLANGQGAGAVTGAALTLTDDETLPTAALALGPASISEEGGVSTVSATLSGPSSEATTITVAAAAGAGAAAGDFALSTGTTLTLAAGATTSNGVVTVRANGNNVASGSKQVVVSGTSAGGNGVANPANAALTLTDDDTPRAALMLSSSSISESGGIATVTATLDRQSSVAVTVTVAAAAGANAVAGDFTLSTATTLTFAANATTSTGLVTVTAVNDTTDAPNKSVTVSGTASDSLGDLANDPPDVTLAITDDDAAPGVVLSLNPGSVSENGGTSAVSATLSHPSSEASTVTVTGAAGLYTVGTDATITIAAGSTTAASDTATVAGVDDDVHQGNAGRSATVSATLANGQGAGAVTGATLTLTDDETLPTLSLALGPSSISESGGVSTVTAELSGPSSAALTVTVAAAAGTGAAAADFDLSTATTLTIAAGATTSTGVVTVTANGNTVDAPDKSVTVSGAASGGHGAANPSDATLTLTDDEATATATLVLTPPSILENGGLSTVTAVLSHPTTEATTLTVSTAAVSPAVSGDFTRTGNTLTIAASATTSTGLVTVTAVDDSVVSGTKRVRVSASASGGRGVGAPSVATLLIRDDEYGLDVGLVTGQATEAGGRSTFPVSLNTQPAAAVTVAVTSLDPGEGRAAPSSLVFTTTSWSTSQTVTVTGVQDNVDDGDVTWQVRLDPSSGDASYDGLTDVDVDVSTTDDDDAPGVTLVLNPSSISEAGGVSTVTAVLTRPSSSATTVTVAATAVAPAAAGDFTLSTAAALTIAAGATASTGVVTLTAVDNDVDAPDKSVTVSGTASNGRAAADSMTVAVTGATLTVEDDDERGLALTPAEGLDVTPGGSDVTYEAALATRPSAAVTVSVTSDRDGMTLGVGPSPTTFAGTVSLTFLPAARNWEMPQTVTVRASATAGAGGEDAADAVSATLLHTPSGEGGYGAAETTPYPVAVLDPSAVRVPEVRVSRTVRQAYRFTVSGRTVRIVTRPLSGTEVPEASGGWRLALSEPSGPSARQGVDVEVSGDVGDGLTVCLPVLAEERTAAGGGTLVVLHHRAGAWTRAGAGQAVRGGEVCAHGVRSFSPFALGVEEPAADAKARMKGLNESILPELSGASWASAMEAVSGRVGSFGAGGSGSGPGLAVSAGEFLGRHGESLESGGSWKELLGGESFAVGLGGEGEGSSGGPPGAVTLWGRGDYRKLSRDEGGLDWSGDLFAAHAGADAALGPGWMGGVGVSWFESELDYTDRRGDESVEGEHRSRMTSVQPYVGWRPRPGTRAWASVGYGRGEVEVRDEAERERFGSQRSDSRLLGAALGGAVRWETERALRVDFKGEAQATRYELRGNGSLLEGLSVRTRRLRLSAEGSREYALSGGGRVAPSGELGVRWDGGDGATGAGVEVGAGVSWSAAGGRLSLEARGRTLAAHRSGLDEWGLSGGLRVAPRPNGRGLSLSVQPVWGASESARSRLWEEGMAGRRAPSGGGAVGAGLDAELGWGAGAFRGFGSATPYLRYGQAQEGERRYGLGWRLARPAGGFGLGLESWRRERGPDRPVHGVGITLDMRW